MRATISTAGRRTVEARWGASNLIVAMEITHPQIGETIRVINDIVDFTWKGETYIGAPFGCQLLSDNERYPVANITVQNVDSRIGEGVRNLIDPPWVDMYVLNSDDFSPFDPVTRKRTEIGTPYVEYHASYLRLSRINVNAMQVSADLVSWDFTGEPWPYIRATKNNFPGLFMR